MTIGETLDTVVDFAMEHPWLFVVGLATLLVFLGFELTDLPVLFIFGAILFAALWWPRHPNGGTP